MRNGEYHIERLYKGKKIIIDMAQVPFPYGKGAYEVMVMTDRGEEMECYGFDNEMEAAKVFLEMAAKYPESPAPLTGKYAVLREALKIAIAAGQNAETQSPEDSGTCNRDAPALNLPRWNSAKVEQAAKEAGTSCSTWTLYGCRMFVFMPRTHAQANARSRNAEAMAGALRQAGYDCQMYYAMD